MGVWCPLCARCRTVPAILGRRVLRTQVVANTQMSPDTPWPEDRPHTRFRFCQPFRSRVRDETRFDRPPLPTGAYVAPVETKRQDYTTPLAASAETELCQLGRNSGQPLACASRKSASDSHRFRQYPNCGKCDILEPAYHRLRRNSDRRRALRALIVNFPR